MTRVKRMMRNEDDDDKDEEGGCFMRMRVQRRAGYVTAIQQMDKSLTLLILLTLMYVYSIYNYTYNKFSCLCLVRAECKFIHINAC